jgi:DnaJ-class molecular chaperone
MAKVTCGRCGGSGNIPSFNHYAKGVCFQCGGTGETARILGSQDPGAQETGEADYFYENYYTFATPESMEDLDNERA